MLEGTTRVTVKSRSVAAELFVMRYLGYGYKNMTRENATSAKNLVSWLTLRAAVKDTVTLKGTYHWDEKWEIVNGKRRVLGHELEGKDGDFPHLQVHELSGRIVRIFFPWGKDK